MSYSPETIISVTSLLVAAMATLFVLYQARLSRIHNRLSVRPHLFTEVRGSKDDKFYYLSLFLVNNGLGPAFINDQKVFIDNKLIGSSSDIPDFLTKFSILKTEFNDVNLYPSIFPQDTAMAANQERSLLRIEITRTNENSYDETYKFNNLIVRFDFEISYRCAYGNKYKIDTRALKPTEKVRPV